MIVGHPSVAQLEAYRQKRLSAADLLAVDDHLAVCGACRDRITHPHILQPSVMSFQNDLEAPARQPPEHLPYELLEALVDRTASDNEQEIADAHLEACHACSCELEELRAFKTQIAAWPAQDSPSAGLSRRKRWSIPLLRRAR
jgi:hypothetical protein